MRTLYVTDLDGTLMRDDKIISNEIVDILNRLLSQGMFLTYATARLLSSASGITRNISFNLPSLSATEQSLPILSPREKSRFQSLEKNYSTFDGLWLISPSPVSRPLILARMK